MIEKSQAISFHPDPKGLNQFAKMKPSGVKWIGNVPDHWTVIKLGRALFMQEGPGLRNWQFTSEGTRVICVTNITDEGIDFARLEKFISTEEYKLNYRHFTVRYCDVLLSSSGNSWGKVAVYNAHEEVILNTSTIRLNETKDSPISRDFIPWLIQSYPVREQLGVAMTGSCQPNFGPTHLNTVIVAIPPKNEQSWISKFLKVETAKIDALIAEQERLIELLKEKRQAVISHAVTKGLDPHAKKKPSGADWIGEIPEDWEPIKLKNLYRQTKRQDQEGKKILSVYREFGVIYKDSRGDNMNKTPDDLSSYQLVNPGDLVINKMKAWQGSLGVSELEGITSPDYVVFSPVHDNNHLFLHHLLRSKNIVSVYRGISNGIRPSQWRIEPDVFLNLKIFIPKLTDQIKIVSFIEDECSRFDRLVSESERAITLLQERRTAVISAAVTGQINVQGLAPLVSL